MDGWSVWNYSQRREAHIEILLRLSLIISSENHHQGATLVLCLHSSVLLTKTENKQIWIILHKLVQKASG